MSNSWFKFKQFNLQQEHSAMKVGTDGVLLGAWAGTGNHKKALDIGCGTGLIALMLAQRYSDLIIDAVEIDGSSCIDARKNINDSPWKDRISLYNMAIQDFKKNVEMASYDLILSNPPYFRHSLKPLDESRAAARHDETLELNEIIEISSVLLNPDGILGMIIPSALAADVIMEAEKSSLYPFRKLWVRPTPDKMINRLLIEFSFQNKLLSKEELVIEEFGRHKYSAGYIKLTRDFYLKME